jgi:hypothetical protein
MVRVAEPLILARYLLQLTAVPVACYGDTNHVIRKLPFCPDNGAGYLPAYATCPQHFHISSLSYHQWYLRLPTPQNN